MKQFSLICQDNKNCKRRLTKTSATPKATWDDKQKKRWQQKSKRLVYDNIPVAIATYNMRYE